MTPDLHTTTTRPRPALSRQQRDVLLHLYRLTLDRDYVYETCPAWGVPWQTRGLTRSESASLSRTLARLEGHGLILRQNPQTGNNATPGAEGRVRVDGEGRRASSRTTAIHVTTIGMILAERLTTKPECDVNRRPAA